MNVKPAPFVLNERTVSALLGGGESNLSMSGVAVVPVLKLRLVNVPRRSEDPRLARGNDNSLLPPPGETIRSGVDGARGADSGNLPVPDPAPHVFPDLVGGEGTDA